MIWRIRERAAFDRLGRDGHRIRATTNADHSRTRSSMAVWCTYLPDPAAAPPRVAYAIGRVVGPAVVRNRLRRRLRAMLADRAETLPPGWYLFGARPSVIELTFDDLADEVDALLQGVRSVGPGADVRALDENPVRV